MKKILLTVLVFLCSVSMSYATDITLAWDDYIDKADISSFRLKIGETAGGPYSTAVIEIPNPSAITYTIAAFQSTYPKKKYYFILTAYDETDGFESPPSNEVSYRRPLTVIKNLLLTIK